MRTMGYKRTGRPTGRPSNHTPEQWKLAEQLLDDGASYRETAYTTGIPRTTISDRFPGRGWTAKQGADMLGFIRKHQQIFDEVSDPMRRVKTDNPGITLDHSEEEGME